VDHKIMKEFVQGLGAGEASRVLQVLLDSDPGLVKKAYRAAVEVAGDVDPYEIMDDVFSSLENLDEDDLGSRAGRTRYGYVEPCDAAWEMFEEALGPFIYEMKRNQERALPAVAKAHCIGIIKGLQRYEGESISELSDWLVDAPGEFIDTVVMEWKKGNPSEEDIEEVMGIARGSLPTL